MNHRKYNRRAVLRARRRGTVPTLTMRMGETDVQVQPAFRAGRASYRTRHAQVFGTWPPTPEITRELRRWS